MTNLDWALKYASIGWYVFPIAPNAKVPTKGSAGFNDATIDPEKIREMWARHPNANIGVWASKNSGVFCLDIDKKDDKNGFLWLGAQEDLPPTCQQTTPSKSTQFIFKMPETYFISSADLIAKGVDIRCNNGYFVVPPSFVARTDKYHYEGEYEWLTDQSPFEMQPADAPQWLIDEIMKVSAPPEIEESDTDDKRLVTMDMVIDAYPVLKSMRVNSDIIHGAHPIHGSSNGANFRIDIKKNVWACYRHMNKETGKCVGGDPLRLIAMMEGILQCEECVKGSLTGEKFKKVLNIVRDKFGISPDSFNNGKLESLLDLIQPIKDISPKWKQMKAVEDLCPKIAKLKTIDRQSFLDALKESLDLSREDMTSIKQELKKSAKESSKFDHSWDTDEFGNIINTDKNVINILTTDKEFIGCFRRNTFSDELDVCRNGTWEKKKDMVPRPITDDDDLQVKRFILDHYDIECKMNQVAECITHIAISNNYNPVLDYLGSIKWDGVPRLATWMSNYLGVADSDYYRHVAQMFFISAVRRAKRPGCQYDHVICLAGGQGIFKSTMIKAIGDQWYLPIHLKDDIKNTVQKMQGQWFLEIPEGVSFSNKDIEELKAFITETFNRERFAYGRRIAKYNRKSVFVLTINPKTIGYLADPTGNRRFVPVTIKKDIDLLSIKSVRDQLFAEAVLLEPDFKCYIDKNDESVMKGYMEEIEMAEVQDDWMDVILEWISSGLMLSKTRLDSRGYSALEKIEAEVSCLDIWISALRGDMKSYNQYKEGRRIGEIMRKLGCDIVIKRDSGSIVKKFDISKFIKTPEEQAQSIANKQYQTPWTE
jgi:predicted P-loop ATPase